MNYKNAEHIFHEAVKNDLPCLTFEGFEQYPIADHLFTTREGGVSEGIYATMNLSFTRGDVEANVQENYRRVAVALSGKADDIVCSDQTHTTNIRIVSREDCGKGVVSKKDYTDVDGLMTNVPEIILGCFFADCVPLFFLDPVKQVVSVCHSGWRGTVGRIGAKAVELMRKTYGSNPEDVICGIGPSICRDCYEIGEDVAEQFRQFAFRDDILTRDETVPGMDQKYHLDLWECNRRILIEAGVVPEHIFTTNLCTCCNKDKLFSHRGSNGLRGNLGAFIKLRKS